MSTKKRNSDTSRQKTLEDGWNDNTAIEYNDRDGYKDMLQKLSQTYNGRSFKSVTPDETQKIVQQLRYVYTQQNKNGVMLTSCFFLYLKL